MAHKDTLGCAASPLHQGRAALMRTCLGRKEEAFRWQMQYFLQHQMAPAGTGPKFQTPLVTKPSPSGHDKPSQCSVRSPTKAADETVQGAQPEMWGSKVGSSGSVHPWNISLDTMEERYTTSDEILQGLLSAETVTCRGCIFSVL